MLSEKFWEGTYTNDEESVVFYYTGRILESTPPQYCCYLNGVLKSERVDDIGHYLNKYNLHLVVDPERSKRLRETVRLRE